GEARALPFPARSVRTRLAGRNLGVDDETRPVVDADAPAVRRQRIAEVGRVDGLQALPGERQPVVRGGRGVLEPQRRAVGRRGRAGGRRRLAADARVAGVARRAVALMEALPGRAADVVGADVAVAGARRPRGLELTGGVAAIAADRVAVVTLLAGRDDAVAAAGDPTIRIAAVAAGGVAVVAFLAWIVHAVAAGRLDRAHVAPPADRTPDAALIRRLARVAAAAGNRRIRGVHGETACERHTRRGRSAVVLQRAERRIHAEEVAGLVAALTAAADEVVVAGGNHRAPRAPEHDAVPDRHGAGRWPVRDVVDLRDGHVVQDEVVRRRAGDERRRIAEPERANLPLDRRVHHRDGRPPGREDRVAARRRRAGADLVGNDAETAGEEVRVVIAHGGPEDVSHRGIDPAGDVGAVSRHDGVGQREDVRGETAADAADAVPDRDAAHDE